MSKQDKYVVEMENDNDDYRIPKKLTDSDDSDDNKDVLNEKFDPSNAIPKAVEENISVTSTRKDDGSTRKNEVVSEKIVKSFKKTGLMSLLIPFTSIYFLIHDYSKIQMEEHYETKKKFYTFSIFCIVCQIVLLIFFVIALIGFILMLK